MSKFDYSRYKIVIDPDSKKIQGLAVGDVVRRQYKDGNQVIYSLMIVLETGVDIIGEKESSYFIGALVEGDEPQPGELLDFVRVTNLFNTDRTGALYLTSSDSEAPFLDVIDGIAIERSLCFPYIEGADFTLGDSQKYTSTGKDYLDTLYKKSEDEVQRIYRITKNSIPNNGLSSIGFAQTILNSLSHPERIIVSYKIRASKAHKDIPVKLFVNAINQVEGEEKINVSTDWEYKIFIVTIDYPSQYNRLFTIDFASTLSKEGDWCEIAELNIVKLSDIANFNDSTKARVGKIKGIADPVFGVLEGYGAYFQHLYATRNVNIAGTLTAGDENGFSSVFYVGKIHKNVIRNSLDGQFVDPYTKSIEETPPAGMGSVWEMGAFARIYIQSSDWRKEHIGQMYCFSIWVKVDQYTNFTIYQDEYSVKSIDVSPEDKWKRIHASFPILDSENSNLSIRIDIDNVGALLSSPQMEAGASPSQYQPTDGTLSYVEDYGAWFAKGGIGGTIQNPLLRLENDGSIRSKDDSFVINPDGTGHFSGGRFRWTKDTISLQDVLIRWEDLSEDAKENLKGEPGKDGVDANMLDWVKDWDTNKTLISSSSVITPKIFAGEKNSDETITGMAIGKFTMQTRNSSGNIASENINGIYGFHKGLKTFSIDSIGNVQLGTGNQSIKYDVATGKVSFGSEVTLNWTNAIESAKSEAISTAAIDATSKADKAKVDAISDASSDATTKANNALASAKTYTDTKKTEAISEAQSNTTSQINALKTSLETTISAAKKAGEDAQKTADAITKKANDEQWATKLTYIDANGIYTGLLSAKTVEALNINASQITAGTIDVARLNVDALKASLITAGNIEALTLNVVKGKIGGWAIETDSIYRGTKNNTSGAYTSASGSITIGSNGIRGYKWRLDSTGAGAIAGGNISWDATGKVIFSTDVSLNWTTAINNAVEGLYVEGRNYVLESEKERQALTSVSNGGGHIKYSTILTPEMITLNEEFYLSFEAKGTSTGTLQTYNTNQDTRYNSHDVKITTEWKRYQVLKKIALIGKQDLFCEFWGKEANLGIYIRKVKLERGSKCTDWVVANEDIEQRLTYISSTGIYTGTLTAAQINAVSIDAGSIKTGTLNADRIAAGSIKAAKLDATSIKSEIINTTYINGLSLSFTKGTIGGWTIGADNITHGTLGASGATPIQIRTTSSGSGLVYSGDFKPKGITLTWHRGNNAGHIVLGQVMTNATTVKTNYYGIQMMNHSGHEFFCLAADTDLNGSTAYYNRIAGWSFDVDSIYRGTKNNTATAFTSASGSITMGSNGIRGFKWRLDSTGAGALAGGNISWDASGNVTFAESVKLQWKNDVNNAVKDINTETEVIKELALAMANGKMLYRDPTFYNGNNSIGVYNNSSNGTVTHTRATDSTAPNDSKYVIVIKNTGTSTPNCGGFCFQTMTAYRKIYITRIIAKIPVGRSITFATNSIGTGGTSKWLTPVVGTGDWCEYVLKVSCGTASFSYTNYFSMTGATGTTTTPVEWKIAYATVFDVTSAEKYTTTIDANGIYTGTLTANQVNAVSIDAASIKTGTLSADRIAASSIGSAKLKADEIKANIINTAYINGLTCTFVRGTIGGWTIGTDNITHGSVGGTGATPIQIRTTSTGSGYWYTGAYKPKGITLTWHQSGNAGHIVFGQVAASGNTVKTGFFGLQMMSWDNQEYFCLSANATKSGSKEIYNRIAGWTFDNDSIYRGTKNNTAAAFTAASGSITIGSNGLRGFKWRLDSTGAGSIAGGNITWDAAGNVTFGSSVSLKWTNLVDESKELARAMAFGKMLYRYPEFYYNGAVHYNGTNNYLGNTTRSIIAYAGTPNSTGYALRYVATNWHSATDLRIGGFHFANPSRANAKFLVRIIALIPSGRSIQNYHNAYGTGQTQKWLTSQAGTGKWEEYLCLVKCGSSGTFSTVNHFALTGGAAPTAAAPVTWYIAYATVFDITATEKYTTTITADGVYTGIIKANQVQIDSALVVGGSSYDGSISVRNASNAVLVTLNRSGITATAGKIGGWTISASQISSGSVIINSNGNIQNSTKWQLNNDGSGRLASGNITWTAAGVVTITGTINATKGQIGGFSVDSGRIGSTASGAGTGGGLSIYNDLIRVGTTTSYTLLGGNTFPATSGGHMATARFTNTRSSTTLNNYGVYCDVKNSTKNYGLWSNASVVAPACIGNSLQYTGFTGSGYNWDFSQHNIFYVYATAYYSITLPTEASVARMFNLSTLPANFGYIFTIVYQYNYGNKIRIDGVRNNNGDLKNIDMAKGDVLTLLCTKRPSFNYQIINHHS